MPTVSKASLSVLASRLQGVTTDRLLEISFGTAVDAPKAPHVPGFYGKPLLSGGRRSYEMGPVKESARAVQWSRPVAPATMDPPASMIELPPPPPLPPAAASPVSGIDPTTMFTALGSRRGATVARPPSMPPPPTHRPRLGDASFSCGGWVPTTTDAQAGSGGVVVMSSAALTARLGHTLAGHTLQATISDTVHAHDGAPLISASASGGNVLGYLRALSASGGDGPPRAVVAGRIAAGLPDETSSRELSVGGVSRAFIAASAAAAASLAASEHLAPTFDPSKHDLLPAKPAADGASSLWASLDASMPDRATLSALEAPKHSKSAGAMAASAAEDDAAAASERAAVHAPANWRQPRRVPIPAAAAVAADACREAPGPGASGTSGRLGGPRRVCVSGTGTPSATGARAGAERLAVSTSSPALRSRSDIIPRTNSVAEATAATRLERSLGSAGAAATVRAAAEQRTTARASASTEREDVNPTSPLRPRPKVPTRGWPRAAEQPILDLPSPPLAATARPAAAGRSSSAAAGTDDEGHSRGGEMQSPPIFRAIRSAASQAAAASLALSCGGATEAVEAATAPEAPVVPPKAANGYTCAAAAAACAATAATVESTAYDVRPLPPPPLAAIAPKPPPMPPSQPPPSATTSDSEVSSPFSSIPLHRSRLASAVAPSTGVLGAACPSSTAAGATGTSSTGTAGGSPPDWAHPPLTALP